MLFDSFGPFSCSLLAAVFLQTYNVFGFALGPFVHFLMPFTERAIGCIVSSDFFYGAVF